MYTVLAERRAPIFKATHVTYGPYASEEEAEAAKTKLASLLEPYGDTTFAIKELLSADGSEGSVLVPVPHVCPAPVMIPYPWPFPYLLPSPPPWRPWVYHNPYYVQSVPLDTGSAVGPVMGV